MPENWDQVKELFTLALERDPAERSSFLRQACGERRLPAQRNRIAAVQLRWRRDLS